MLWVAVGAGEACGAWAEDMTSGQDIVIVRAADGEARREGVVPFTTFEAERQAIVAQLPCKWMSMGGRLGPSYGNARYDMLCKGGDWATIALYMDKPMRAPDAVGAVKLLYREWKTPINPNAGEAYIAQRFLQHVVAHFVPSKLAAPAAEAFWQSKSRSWTTETVRVTFTLEQGAEFNVRRLAIEGLNRGKEFNPAAEPALATGLTVALPLPTSASIPVQPVEHQPDRQVGRDLLNVVAKPVPPQPLSLPTPQPVLELTPRTSGLVVPENTPAGGTGLVSATAAELDTAPAPESKSAPAVLQGVSRSLVPDPAQVVTGRALAPSNFDIYNKATALTSAEERRAAIMGGQDKVVDARTAAQATAKLVSGTFTAPPPVSGPQLQALPVPVVARDTTKVVSASLVATGGLAVAPSVSAPSPVAEAAASTSSRTSRPLPQLRFIPKAEPVANPAEVIRFEDEKSRL